MILKGINIPEADSRTAQDVKQAYREVDDYAGVNMDVNPFLHGIASASLLTVWHGFFGCRNCLDIIMLQEYPNGQFYDYALGLFVYLFV